MTQPAPIRRAPSLGPATPQLSTAERLFGSLYVGATQDPLIGAFVENVLTDIPGTRREDIDALSRRLGDSTLTNIGEIVGEYGPSILAGMGAYALGRAALTTGLKAASPHLAAQAARLLPGAAHPLLTKPAALRAVQVAGGALGTGAFTGAESAAAGGDVYEVGRAAAIGALLSAGTEGALIGATKVLPNVGIGPIKPFGFMRPLSPVQNPESAIKNFRSARRASLDPARRELTEQVHAEQQAYLKIINLEEQNRSVANAVRHTVGLGDLPPGVSLLTLEEARLAQQMGQNIDAARATLDAATKFGRTRELIPGLLTSTRPDKIKPGGMREYFEKFLANVIQSPERTAQKTGPIGSRIGQLNLEVENYAILANRAAEVTVGKYTDELLDVLGVAGQGVSSPALRSALGKIEQYGTRLTAAERNALLKYGKIEQDLFSLGRLAEQHGLGAGASSGGVLPVAGEAHALGRRVLIPHVPKDDFVEPKYHKRLVDYMRKKGDPTPEATAAEVLHRADDGHLFWSDQLSLWRTIPGTLEEKIAAGLPFEDPMTGILRWTQKLHFQIEQAKRYGPQGALRDTLVGMGEAAGANAGLLSTLIDSGLRRPYYSAASKRFADVVTSAESATKLTFTAITNLSQIGNTAIFTGLRPTLASVWAGVTRTRTDAAKKAAGLLTLDNDIMGELLGQRASNSIISRAARRTMKWTLFTPTERSARLTAATGTAYWANDTVARGFAGKLGGAFAPARRQMARVGIDLDRVLKEGRKHLDAGRTVEEIVDAVHGPGAWENALLRGVQEAQHSHAANRLPFWWSRPEMRVLVQFKRFALSQGQFIRDRVLAEAAEGNYKPLLIFTGFYPVAGEVIASSIAGLKGRERKLEGPARLLEDVSNVGAFGLVSQTIAGAAFGKPLESILGPAVSDLSALAVNFVRFDLEGVGRSLARQPVVQGARTVALGTIAAGQLAAQVAAEAAEEIEGTDFEQWRDENLRSGR